MKTILTTVMLFFITVSMVAQSGSIQGKVVDNTNEPLIGVSVTIKGTTKGASTDMEGNFTIKNVERGSYTIVASYIGYKTKELVVSAPASSINIILFEGNEILQEVVLQTRNNKFSRKKTAYVAKLPLKDIENAQVYTTVTSELLESQVVTSIDDALNNATGVSKLWESTGRSPDNGTGWFSTRGFATQPALVDGMPGYILTAVDPSYIERIEVIKGPSATLFGKIGRAHV